MIHGVALAIALTLSGGERTHAPAASLHCEKESKPRVSRAFVPDARSVDAFDSLVQQAAYRWRRRR